MWSNKYYVSSEWSESPSTLRGKPGMKLGKRPSFPWLQTLEKMGSTFPDCFPIPSGYYTVQFVWNSAINEMLFHVLTFSVTWGKITVIKCAPSTTISNPIYWCLSHRSKYRCHFSCWSYWNTRHLSILCDWSSCHRCPNHEPSFKVTLIFSSCQN